MHKQQCKILWVKREARVHPSWTNMLHIIKPSDECEGFNLIISIS